MIFACLVVLAVAPMLRPQEQGPGSRATMAALVGALGSEEQGRRTAAADDLVRRGAEAVPALIAALSEDPGPGDSARVQVEAITVLARIGEPAVTSLIGSLRSMDEGLRASAAFALGQIGPRASAATPTLVELMRDSRSPLRRAAGAALRRMGPAAIRPLIECLADADEKLVGLASHALAGSGSEAVAPLVQLVDGEDPTLRKRAATVLGMIGGKAVAAVPALAALAKSGGGGQPQPENPIVPLLWENPPAQAAIALGRIGPAAVPVLTDMLRNEDPALRSLAVLGFGELGANARGAVGPLKDSLREPDKQILASIIQALGRIGREARAAIPDLIEIMANEDEILSARAADALIRIGKHSCTSLVAALRTGGPALREKVIQTLGRILQHPSLVVPALVAALDDRELAVRTQAARVLVLYGNEAVTGLASRLDHASPAARLQAAAILRDIAAPAPESVAALGRALRDQDREVRAVALKGLACVGRSGVPELMREFERASPPERLAVLGALAQMEREAEPAVPALAALLAEHRDLREAAAKALGRIGPGAQAAVPALARLLEEPDHGVQVAACQALGKIGAPAAIAPLLALLKRDSEHRAAALEALARIGGLPDEAAGAIAVCLADASSSVRASAAGALATMGSRANGSLAALVALLVDPVPSVRAAAAVAAGRVGPGDEAAVRALADSSADADGRVSAKSCAALVEGGRESFAILVRLLEKGEPATRGKAADAVASVAQRCGKPWAIDAAIAALERARLDPEASVRSRAAEMLALIRRN